MYVGSRIVRPPAVELRKVGVDGCSFYVEAAVVGRGEPWDIVHGERVVGVGYGCGTSA